MLVLHVLSGQTETCPSAHVPETSPAMTAQAESLTSLEEPATAEIPSRPAVSNQGSVVPAPNRPFPQASRLHCFGCLSASFPGACLCPQGLPPEL